MSIEEEVDHLAGETLAIQRFIVALCANSHTGGYAVRCSLLSDAVTIGWLISEIRNASRRRSFRPSLRSAQRPDIAGARRRARMRFFSR